MIIYRFITYGVGCALVMGGHVGPFSPVASVVGNGPAQEPPHAVVSFKKLSYQSLDTVKVEVSYECISGSVRFLTVSFEQDLGGGKEAVGDTTTKQVTCDGVAQDASLEITKNGDSADFDKSVGGEVAIVLMNEDEPTAEGKFAVPAGPSPKSLGSTNESLRWKDRLIPYSFDPAFNEQKKEMALAAMDEWKQKTPIRFIERTAANAEEHPDYVQFKGNDSGCYAYMGRIGGNQSINIGDGCSLGNTIHEIGHAAGLLHEQQRPDRDEYIKIEWENVDDEYKSQFEIENNDMGTFGTPYDFGSIMQYPLSAFSKNGADTMVPISEIPAGVEIGQREGLSSGDISAIQAMYP
ncbi:Astacin (Peptidase family M12A) [Streptomyces noursei ATCC 11455]|uniref:M12 family metallopeptidase n=1 Tax=Streptomyces noursei TaxID=1971 RepID=UPI00081CF1BE|nr:Astacin (Peptidase family M12A) [Streptomyces noursei ATCC 11455]